ncbi:MAG TPA: DUF3426 domain-containing protein [Ramlibacter sp.]|nr:DUF3426 domain-containing protein [Ramlibacter sp.]
MGLITRCPACGTMFKVVADQLKISEGWVRCGHCAEIFDATADLRDESEIDLPAVARTDEREAHPPAPAHGDSEIESVSSNYPSVQSEIRDSELEAAPPDALEIDEQVNVMHKHPLDEPFELRRADTSDVEAAGPHGFSKPMPLQPEPELHDLSFVRQARRRDFWRKPGVRTVLVLVLLALAALLAAQVVYQDRDRLAAANTEMRPWIARMCEAVRCKLGPPRVIDSVAIETSSFNKLRGDAYRLNVTLKNTGSTLVAMPALELTLTDAQDQPVLRRVLQSNEFAPGTASIAAASDWSTTVALAVNATAAGGRVAGYRLIAFYP